MSKKNKWNFIENKEIREELIKASDLLKSCAKTYYIKSMDYYNEMMEPYKKLCAGFGGKGEQNILYVSPELHKIIEEDIEGRCKEEKERFREMLVGWERILNIISLCSILPMDVVEKIRIQVNDDILKMQEAISKR